MVRTLILHGFSALTKTLFANCLVFAAALVAPAAFAHTEHVAEDYAGVVSGNRATFSNLSNSLIGAKNVSATLRLTFVNGQEFSAEQVIVILNGLQCTASAKKFKSHGSWYHDGLARRLGVAMDGLRFGNQVLFLDKVLEVVSFHGQLSLDVRAPHALKAAVLHLEYDVKLPNPPSVTLTHVAPYGPLVTVPNVTFRFTSLDGGVSYECKERGAHTGWVPCTSPKTFSGLKDGNHHFKFRATDKFGQTGKATHYRVHVQAPHPAVVIRKVIPSENPTTSTSIKIHFRRNHGGGRQVQCRLDDKNWADCRSPIQYSNLSDGQHRVSFRRVHWLYQTILGKWFGHFDWFRWLCPQYTEPVIYTWVIQRGVPSAEFVSTPKALTNEIAAHFEFRSDVSASFRCRLDSGALNDCVSPADFNVSDGNHVFEVVPYVGSVSGQAISFRWTVDRTAPVLTAGTIVPAEAVTSSDSLSMRFTSSEPAAFTCSLDGAAEAACVSPVEYSNLTDGGHELSIFATDGAGNRSAALTHEWIVDRTAPGVRLTMTSPQELPTNQASATFEFAAEDGVGFACSLDGEPRASCESPLTVSGLAEGQHQFQVAAVDAAGNVGVASSVAWEVDRTAPVIEIGAVEPSENPTESHSIEIAFDVSEAAEVFCELDAGGQVPCQSPFIAGGIADGNHSVEILAVDAAGNVSQPASHQWRVDSVALVAITAISPEGASVNSRSMSIEFGSTNSSRFVCSLDGAAPSDCASPVAYQDLAEGAHHFEVRALNLSSQPGPAAFHDWSVDTTGPVVTLDSVSPASSPTSSQEITLSFSSNEAVSFLCTVDEAAESPCLSPVTLQELADGNHQISVVGVDSLGNRGNATIHAWAVDRTGPVVAFGAISPAGSPVSALMLTAELTSDEPASFLCSLDGAAEVACASPYQVDVGEGDHSLTVAGVDALGNRGAAVSHSWTVAVPDAAAEFVSISPASSPSASRSAAFEFTASGAVGFVCSLDGAAFADCASPQEFSELGDGSHTFAVAALNIVNRQGPAVSHGWIVDGTGPVVNLLATTPSVSPTAELSLSAHFSANETASFFCSLDGAQEVSCLSPHFVSVGEGSHVLSIAGVDGLGNRGVAAVHNWTVAVPEAVAAITSAEPTGASQSGNFAAFFSGANSVSFECSLDAAAFAACSSPFGAAGLADGIHTFQVRGVNSVGRAGEAASHGWTVDTAGPDAILGAVSPSVSPTASQAMSISFSSAEVGASFRCSVDGGAEVSCSSPHVMAGLGDGSHSFSVVALDSLGNRGNAVSHSWEVDHTGPVVSFGTINPAGSTTSSLTLSAAFSANEPASFLCSLDGGAEGACSSPHSVNVGEGNHTLSVAGVDALGNRGASIIHSWTVAVPDVMAQIDGFTPSASPTASRSASAFFSGAGASGFVCSLDGAAFAACSSPISYSNLSDGGHTFSVAALNSVGHRGPSANHSWSIDTVGPVVQIVSTNPSTSPTSSLSLTANFSANEPASLLCSLDGGAESACSSPHTVNVGEGNHSLSVVGVDGVGNRGASVSHSWTVEVAPATVSITSFTPSAALTQSRNFSAVFSGTNAASFECRLDGAAFAACSSPFQGTGLADGGHTVQIRGLNSLGQVGATATHSWTIDNVGPSVTLVSVTPDWSPTSQNTLTATFSSGETGATFLCQLDGGAENACNSPHTFTNLVDGNHSFAITGLDALGNRGAPISYSWIVDSTALAISNVSVMNVTSNSARIEWTTNFDSTSQVKYGTGSNLNQQTPVNTTYAKTHSMVLTGLSSFTFYSAQAVSVDRDGRTIQSSVVTFRTLRP